MNLFINLIFSHDLVIEVVTLCDVLIKMKAKLLLVLASIFLLGGCTTMPQVKGDQAALYSILNAEGFLVPINYQYSIVRKVDGKTISYDQNPVFLSSGKHQIEIEHGSCFAPVLVIMCEFQPSEIKTIEYNFVGGKEYTLTLSAEKIVEI